MGQMRAFTHQTRHRLDLPTATFPFRSELSLAPLVAAWEAAAAESGIRGDVARAVRGGLERAAELSKPIQLRAIHATPGFRRLLLDGDGMLQGWLNFDAEVAAQGRLLHAYDAILRS